MNNQANRARHDQRAIPVRLIPHPSSFIPSPSRWLGAVVAAVALIVGAGAGPADAPPVTIADLAGYREALDGKPVGAAPVAVGFGELWEKPDDYRGRRVRINGRVARIFH